MRFLFRSDATSTSVSPMTASAARSSATPHTPVFSIIIPVYNVAPYLRECLDSVLAQTYSDWESICVDDGSADGSGAILDEYAAKDKRFRVIHQKNAGVSAARNAALDVARGEWIAFLDSDDYWSVDLLQRLKAHIDENAEVEIISFTPICSVTDGVMDKNLHFVQPTVTTGTEVLWGAAGEYMDLGWHPVDKVYRRKLINSIGLRFNEKVSLGEDALFVNTLYAHAKKIRVCNDIVGYFRRVHSGSTTHNFSLKMWISQIERFASLWRVWKDSGNDAVKVVLRRDAFSVLRIGLAHGGRHRRDCIDFLLASKDVRLILLPFMLKHGTLKSRLVGGAMLLAPSCFMRYLLGMMR